MIAGLANIKLDPFFDRLSTQTLAREDSDCIVSYIFADLASQSGWSPATSAALQGPHPVEDCRPSLEPVLIEEMMGKPLERRQVRPYQTETAKPDEE